VILETISASVQKRSNLRLMNKFKADLIVVGLAQTEVNFSVYLLPWSGLG